MRGILGLAALGWLALPAACLAAPSPERLAERLARAPSLSASVDLTEQVLAAGGIGTVRNGAVARRARKPAAPIAASGSEVLNMAVEEYEGAPGRLTLPDLAKQLRAGGFPFAKPRRATRLVKGFMRGWARGASRNRRDPRSFAARFLAARARGGEWPVKLAKGDYDPRLLRLTQLDVVLFVAAFQRGPQRLWRGSRRGRAAAEPEVAPCSDYRKFQKEQLRELFGDGVANDLDKVLDYGFGTIADEVRGPALEKGLALGLEQGILKVRGRKRPGQRAKGVSAKAAQRVMKALNLLLKVQKLAALYGSVTIDVIPEADTVHKPSGSKEKRAFAALVGLTPEKQREYDAQRERLSKESELTRALRDCLKLLKLPSLTDSGDVAEEMEKWRVRWSFAMLPSHAEINVRDSNYDAGLFKHNLKRLGPTQAGAGPAYVNIKPEGDGDHRGCQPGLRRTFVDAEAELDMSQPPDLSTAMDVLTGNVGGVALEAAQQMFLASVRPSASATMVVEYHVPDRATASAAQVCRTFPLRWTGTASGEFTRGDGITTTWSATFTEFLYDQDPGEFALYNNFENNDPGRPAGRIEWTMRGTDEQGCAVSGSGSTVVTLQLSIQQWDGSYADRVAVVPGGSGGGTRTCPGPPASESTFEGHPDGPWICSPKGAYAEGATTLAGEDPAVDEFFYDRRVTGRCSWRYTTG